MALLTVWVSLWKGADKTHAFCSRYADAHHKTAKTPTAQDTLATFRQNM